MKTAYPKSWSTLAASWLLMVAMLTAVVGQQLLTVKARGINAQLAADLAQPVSSPDQAIKGQVAKSANKSNKETDNKSQHQRAAQGAELHQAQAPASVSIVLPAFLEFIQPDIIPFTIGTARTKLIVHAQYALRLPVLLTRLILQTSILAQAP